jgi:hypothetical protein
LVNGHTLSNIENNLNVLKIWKKGNIMNAWEELFIFKEKCKDRDKLINEQVHFDSSNTFRNVFKNQIPLVFLLANRIKIDAICKRKLFPVANRN